MTDHSGIAKAGKEFEMHTHTFPDGSTSAAHSHANGDVAHQHMIKLIGGLWAIDYANDPMLQAGAQVAYGQPVQAQAQPSHTHSFQPDPPMQSLKAKVAINQTNPNWPVGLKMYFEPGTLLPPCFVWEDDIVYGSPAPEPKKSRADLIWEAIQGASKA